jgi:hypothetical protein
MKKTIATLLFMILAFGANAERDCEQSEGALMRYESKILTAAADFKKRHDGRSLLKITAPLTCILQIQEKSSGWLKYLANSFLRPIFGGPQIQGVPKDDRYEIVARELVKVSEHGSDLIDNSLMGAHARGAWGFYTLFCEKGDVEFCSSFLPDEEQIEIESPLLAASSMILLRKAYYVLKGKQKDEVAERIRQIYQHTPAGPGLKRQVIERIYSELFTRPVTLSLLS